MGIKIINLFISLIIFSLTNSKLESNLISLTLNIISDATSKLQKIVGKDGGAITLSTD